MKNNTNTGSAFCITMLLVILPVSLMSCASDGVIGIVYERPMTSAERKLERIDSFDYRIKDSMTLEDARALYRAEQPPEDIIKVELVDTHRDDGFRELRVYSMARGYGQINKEELWLAEHKDTYTPEVDPDVYRKVRTDLRLLDGNGSGYYPGMGPDDRVGWFELEFERVDSGRHWSMVVYDFTPYVVTPHELMRNALELRIECVITTIGPALVGRKTWHDEQWVAAMWISGKHEVVIVYGQEVDFSEILAQVGTRYPSSLSQAVEIDKKQWGQNEVELRLVQMARITSSDTPDPVAWAGHLKKIAMYISLPDFIDLNSIHEIDWHARGQIEADLQAWWRSNRDQLKWDENLTMLVGG